jgi:cob(I)alamin adenosyltransferase
VAENTYFTGVGDGGYTVIGDTKVKKSSPIADAIGSIDELISYLGVVQCGDITDTIKGHIQSIQDRLFAMNADIAGIIDKRFVPKRPLGNSDIDTIESYIKAVGVGVPKLRLFVIPGGSRGSAELDFARSISRRAERSFIVLYDTYGLDDNRFGASRRYLNRISSYLFWAARYLNAERQVRERNPGSD